MKSVLFYSVYALLLFFPLLELSLRLLQYQPYQHTPFSIESKPEFCISPHKTLGFSLNPGHYEVKLNQGLSYRVHHGPDSLRVSHDSLAGDQLSQLFMMGCSYTYGIGVHDEQSSAYLLQQFLPEYHIRNWAVPGYGTVQSFLQLKQAIEAGNIPAIVVVNYADFHDNRNVLSPQFRKTLNMGFERSNAQLKTLMQHSRIPFLNPSRKENVSPLLKWEPWDSVYQNWRWREQLSSVNFLQDMFDKIHTQRLQPKAQTRYIFTCIQQICQAHNIQLIVAGLTSTSSTRSTLAQLNNLGIETVDISLDLTNCLYNNFPFDSHPNALAHQIFARRIYHKINLLFSCSTENPSLSSSLYSRC